MTNKDAIQRVLDYIDEHITETMTTEELAGLAHFSAYHFSRMFSWHVGRSVMDYVRVRRLEFIVSEFGTDRKLIDLAMDYGFETYSGFTKAFKRHFNGIAPEKYRQAAQAYERPKTPVLLHMNQYTGGIIMTPKMISKEAIKIAGYTIRTTIEEEKNNTDLPAFWYAYSTDGRADKLHGAPFVTNHSQYGVYFDHDPKTDAFSYIIGLEVQEGQDIPSEFKTHTLKPALYAVFSTPPSSDEDFVKNIQGTWVYIMNEWFPTSGYEFAPGASDFEYYREGMQDNGNVCDIYIPVVKKS